MTAFLQKLEKAGAGAIKSFKAGETGASPPHKEEITDAKVLWQQVTEAAQKGDMALYNKLYTEYVQLTSGKQ